MHGSDSPESAAREVGIFFPGLDLTDTSPFARYTLGRRGAAPHQL